ncbi:hypothetical protein ACFY97_30540 [Streptomyces klenkii]|uniref:hypothetical protein n=1 Tax=Streptomyces klenkii TaxID=1420899 RepID=UPI0036ED4F0C
MQPPAGSLHPDRAHPDPEPAEPLPHTRPGPVHWLVTAVALAAVIAVACLTGPREDPAPARAVAPAAATRAPDALAGRYPLRCGPGGGPDVVQQVTSDLDHDGRLETVAVVRCRAGGGTPPSGVYLLAEPRSYGEPPRVLATLVDPREKMTVTALTVTEGTVSATLLGYSSASVPRCCPDMRRTVEWHWKNGKFVLRPHPVAGSV